MIPTMEVPMRALSRRPRLVERRLPGGGLRLVYGTAPERRAAALLGGALVAALGFAAPAGGFPPALYWITGAMVAAGTLSVDLWTLDPARGAERRFGLLPLARRVAFAGTELSRLELRSGEAGETIVGPSDDYARMEAALYGLGRGPWIALVLRLEEGRGLVLAAVPRRHEAEIRADAARISEVMGLPLAELA